MPVSSPKKLCPGYQPIDGYVLEEVIGRGGFGEVWRADAPGGIKKAVKFVFGDHDEHRAERELKSLERIKGVQHPFLLALERFEIVDGQLVIVTELADGSLEDVFKQHRDRGSCGIPRNALLTYLHDAADALDYLHEMYQLQHLDIKPGNLLIVGGHVKVADFGLLKDLRDVDCSMIGGLTPIYAPPEVFDGRPSMNSDQYSLAVMYQELLTGVRPFSGRTIAQLATQHVHNAPNLDPLPPSDQPAIARALEKNPDRRYATCREFVNDLRDPQKRPSSDVSPPTTTGVNSLSLGMTPKAVDNLPQIEGGSAGQSDSTANQTTGTPVLVVALGGEGAKCVARLREQLTQAADTPLQLHAVTIDTDTISLRKLRTAEPTKGTPLNKTLHTPLRSAQEYRSRGTDHLRSVSRRWIYNVPRSGQTEGMRPLGRMALVDHGKELADVMREAVGEVSKNSNGVPPQVFVVGSTSGGTSSGMYVDVVHVLRSHLDDAGLESTRVISLLLAPAMRSDPRRPLVLHDTRAALNEISHFLRPGNSYPGDPGAGWASVPAARTPLRDTYVISAATEPGMPTPSQTACEYIWLHGTGASELLNSARRGRDDNESMSIETSVVRSVGIVQLSGAQTRQQRLMASTGARTLLLQWLGNPHSARKSAPTVADRMKRRARIGIAEFVEPTIRSFGDDRNARRAKLMMHLRSIPVEQLRDDRSCRESILEFLDQHTELQEPTQVVRQVAAALQRELSVRLHDGDCDLATATESIRLLKSRITKEIESDGGESADAFASETKYESPLDEQSASNPDRSAPENSEGSGSLINQLRRSTGIAENVLEMSAMRHAKSVLGSICEMLQRLEDRMADGAAKVVQAIRVTESGASSKADTWNDLPENVRERLEKISGEVHSRVAPQWLVRLLADSAAAIDPVEMSSKLISEFENLVSDHTAGVANHSAVNSDQSAMIDGTASTLSSTSRTSDTYASKTSLIRSADDTGESERTAVGMPPVGDTITSAMSNGDSSSRQPIVIRPPTVEDALRAVRPPLLDCGGSQRVVLIVGSENEKSQYEASVKEAHDGDVTVALIPHCGPSIVHEAQQIEIDEIVSRLDALTGGQSEISRRLLSRCDVDWSID